MLLTMDWLSRRLPCTPHNAQEQAATLPKEGTWVLPCNAPKGSLCSFGAQGADLACGAHDPMPAPAPTPGPSSQASTARAHGCLFWTSRPVGARDPLTWCQECGGTQRKEITLVLDQSMFAWKHYI